MPLLDTTFDQQKFMVIEGAYTLQITNIILELCDCRIMTLIAYS
jgi:hypothetical protein